MGTTTPNISIYVPAAGETNYDQAFLAGMLNVDGHNHTGGPDNGVILGNASLATPFVTIDGTQINLGTPVVNPNWPSRSSFSAFLSAPLVNTTGDGTDFLIPFDSTAWNQGANFTVGAGAHFTAPVTGKYLLNATVYLQGLTGAHTVGTLFIATTTRTYFGTTSSYGACRSNNNEIVADISVIADMTAGNTANLHIAVANGAKVITIAANPAAQPLTIFQGYLVL